MRISLDASSLGLTEKSNAEDLYLHDLLNHLFPLLGRDHDDEVTMYVSQDFEPENELPFNVHKQTLSSSSNRWGIWWKSFTKPADILLFSFSKVPFFTRGKFIVFIPDLAFRVVKNDAPWKENFLISLKMRRVVKNAYRILVASETTKEDLIRFYRCKAEKIVVVPPGNPEINPLLYFSTEQKQAYQKQFSLKEHELFIFYSGILETKKNIVRLLQAFKRFLVEFPDWKLILAGERGYGFADIWKTVLELQLEGSVIMPGAITEDEKAFLYSHCRIVAFPSLYEGIGSQVLEGFAYRRPVLTSRNSALGQIAGDSAYLVNPEKVEEIGVGLKRLAGDGMLASRLIQKGEVRLQSFSWEKSAEKVYAMLKES